MKIIFEVKQIDEERLKAARKEGSEESKKLAARMCDFVWIFNLDYDPKVDGYRTVKTGFPVPDTQLDIFNNLIKKIGCSVTEIGKHY